MRLLLLYLERRGWIIGMEVKYDAKMLAKLALIFFGLLFLVCVWLGRKTAVKEAPEGEQITAEDAVILLEALEGSGQFYRWQAPNGGGYLCRWDGHRLTVEAAL